MIKAAADGEWTPLGTGKFRDDFVTVFFVTEPVEFAVEVQESKSKPGLYRVVSPYKNYPYRPAVFDGDTYLEIDASVSDKVYLKMYDTGLDWGEGNMIINSIAYDRLEKEGTIENAYRDGECGTIEDGVITFPVKTLLAQMIYVTGDDLWGFANAAGKFRLVLPGAPEVDMDITVNGMEEKDGKNYISVKISAGKDCETVKVAMIEGDYDESMAGKIADGTIASQEIAGGGDVLFPYDKDGVYTFVAVPYYQGKPRRATHKTTELSFLQVGWKSHGTGLYREGFFSDAESGLQIGLDECQEMDVEIQESTETPVCSVSLTPTDCSIYTQARPIMTRAAGTTWR